MAPDMLYDDLPLSVRLDSSGQYYQFGVFMDGAYVVIFNRKTGGVNDDIARAKDEAARAAKTPDALPTESLTPPAE